MIFQSSAEVTAWPERIALTFLFFLILGVIYFAMYKNWQRKADRDSELTPPLRIAHRLPQARYLGTYVGTTYANDWLKRVHAYGLALPSKAEVAFFSDGIGILFGDRDIFIPSQTVVSIRSTNALAGKVFEAEGLIVITWMLGDVEVVSGFRAGNTEDHVAILAKGATVG